MRSSAALLVTVLLAVSAAAGVGAAAPADDRVRAPTNDLSDSALSVSENSHSLSEKSPSVSGHAYSTTSTVDGTPSNGTNVTARDETKLHVALRKNGDARWNVTAQFALRNENETAAFRELASSYENGNADAGPSVATFERIAERAASETGRQMEIGNVTRSARLVQNGSVGVLSLSFTWNNFTRTEDRQVVMGDAFWFGSETWLPSLNEDQTLVFVAPDEYQINDASPSGGTIRDARVLSYEGPKTFQSGEFTVTYSPKNAPPTASERLPDLSGASGLIILLFLFSAGGVGAYALFQRRGADPVRETEDSDDESPAVPVRGDEAGPDGRGGESDAEEDDGPATELLSDEERVLRLLRDNDGRMKQAQIVKETNWSNAKVSQLLSKMSDDGDVDKLRIGRENLITLPDEDVTDTE